MRDRTACRAQSGQGGRTGACRGPPARWNRRCRRYRQPPPERSASGSPPAALPVRQISKRATKLTERGGTFGWRREAVIRKEDDAAGAQPPRRLDVVEHLIARQTIGPDARPQPLAAGQAGSRGDLGRENGAVGRVGHWTDDIDEILRH